MYIVHSVLKGARGHLGYKSVILELEGRKELERKKSSMNLYSSRNPFVTQLESIFFY